MAEGKTEDLDEVEKKFGKMSTKMETNEKGEPITVYSVAAASDRTEL